MSLSGRACSFSIFRFFRLQLANATADMRLCVETFAPHRRKSTMRTGLTLALILAPTAALAHPGLGDAHGFVQGLAHPLGGPDHLLAMLAVGMLAWNLDGRARWLVPATFLLLLAAGAVLSGFPLPFTEIAIAVSVITLGGMIASGVRAPTAIAMALAGLFAVFHGHAHGAEMPADASGTAYGIGFMLASALIIVGGAALGALLGRIAPLSYRLGGGLVALAGLGFLIHAI
jgi:urease accessory protein